MTTDETRERFPVLSAAGILKEPVTYAPAGFASARDLGMDGKRLVHVEKSGPAFCPDTPVVDQLMLSLQAQSVRAVGELIHALRRSCLRDVCATWPRVLKLVGVKTHGVRTYPRQSWEWVEMRERVEVALCYAEQPDAIEWQQADAHLRGYALQAAMAGESRTMREIGAEDMALYTERIEAYRAFADGRN